MRVTLKPLTKEITAASYAAGKRAEPQISCCSGDNVELSFDDSAIDAIAEKRGCPTKIRKTVGARRCALC